MGVACGYVIELCVIIDSVAEARCFVSIAPGVILWGKLSLFSYLELCERSSLKTGIGSKKSSYKVSVRTKQKTRVLIMALLAPCELWISLIRLRDLICDTPVSS